MTSEFFTCSKKWFYLFDQFFRSVQVKKFSPSFTNAKQRTNTEISRKWKFPLTHPQISETMEIISGFGELCSLHGEPRNGTTNSFLVKIQNWLNAFCKATPQIIFSILLVEWNGQLAREPVGWPLLCNRSLTESN